ncbi:YTH domain-containing protein ECT2-like isoform X2 [Andrographis paniculata]|uniref:YTH domain-containing protein ECT2-like isoform X2 n=1 Tax=Andrographis paniculata TaxID=175694 RepID=UPI0021E85B08|nr:YTH domain-containing protein ECT2-like isoform X2 [Andrographis paniculata]
MTDGENVESPELLGSDPTSETPPELFDEVKGKDDVPSEPISAASPVSDNASRDQHVDHSSALKQVIRPSTNRGYNGPFAHPRSTHIFSRPAGTRKPSGYSFVRTNNNQFDRTLDFPSNPNLKQSSDSPKTVHQSMPEKPPSKIGSNARSSSPVDYQSNHRAGYDRGRYNSHESDGRNGSLTNFTCGRGPRFYSGRNNLSKSGEAARLVLEPGRYNYNSEDFPVEYEDAIFFMIKPVNEDDVHKAIKYNVWSSTPNGNKKLDAAFEEYEAKSIETGKECPVNKSGQTVGVAEMIGPVDFAKDLNFWLTKDWQGFFPITWHIIKDVPNAVFRHIDPDNSENKIITHRWDTGKIGFKQGLEMLRIMKSYSSTTSILDDFGYYENREKGLRARRIAETRGEARSAEGDNGSR